MAATPTAPLTFHISYAPWAGKELLLPLRECVFGVAVPEKMEDGESAHALLVDMVDRTDPVLVDVVCLTDSIRVLVGSPRMIGGVMGNAVAISSTSSLPTLHSTKSLPIILFFPHSTSPTLFTLITALTSHGGIAMGDITIPPPSTTPPPPTSPPSPHPSLPSHFDLWTELQGDGLEAELRKSGVDPAAFEAACNDPSFVKQVLDAL